jgi:hypothetical protein
VALGVIKRCDPRFGATVRNLAAWMMFRKVTVEQFVAILADAPTGETAEKMKRDLAVEFDEESGNHFDESDEEEEEEEEAVPESKNDGKENEPINQSVEEAINQILDGKSDAFKAKYRSIYCSQLSATKKSGPKFVPPRLDEPAFCMKADNSRIEMNHPARLPSAKSSTNSRVIRGAEITYVAIQLTKSKDPDARPFSGPKWQCCTTNTCSIHNTLFTFFFTPPGHFLFAPIELLRRHKLI